MRFSRNIHMSCKRVSLSIRVMLKNLEGFLLLGLLREKIKYIWVPFLELEDTKILSLGPSGTLIKEQVTMLSVAAVKL